ncbi:MAG: AAA family ATPase [Gemmatimonadetes bacterium]|nr:AAA family ATPase [Gemmatimonadota bacterium]MCC7132386.1 AAA family ATPase [Gemmatimonadales bacterium]
MKTVALFGHRHLQDDLLKAFRAGRLPQVLLLTGSPGVGKQTLGRWIAATLLCQSGAQAAPCGTCQGCRLANDLSHPDFHWFVPILRPKAADQDKQIEEVKETLGEVMAARRENPVYGAPDGLTMHGVASARLLLRTAAMTTVMGGRRVILVGDAERLVPQESSQEAANALLKFLEEPPASTTVILTTTDPTRVLPTIRSRAVPIRLGRLSAEAVEEGLAHFVPALSAADRRARVAAAEGSLGRALDAAANAGALAQADQLLAVCRQGGTARFERVMKQGSFAARGEFSSLLESLSLTLANAARASAGGPGTVSEPLRDVPPDRCLAALERVDAAKESALGNVNPQLILATLTGELSEALWA